MSAGLDTGWCIGPFVAVERVGADGDDCCGIGLSNECIVCLRLSRGLNWSGKVVRCLMSVIDFLSMQYSDHPESRVIDGGVLDSGHLV